MLKLSLLDPCLQDWTEGGVNYSGLHKFLLTIHDYDHVGFLVLDLDQPGQGDSFHGLTLQWPSEGPLDSHLEILHSHLQGGMVLLLVVEQHTVGALVPQTIDVEISTVEGGMARFSPIQGQFPILYAF